MRGPIRRLFCIDLQVDPTRGLRPDARCIFGARQLLVMGRRLGWEIVHTRLRLDAAPTPESEALTAALRPLTHETVIMRRERGLARSPGFLRLLDNWRRETIYVAAFDYMALLSCLLECQETGPGILLVEDAMPAAFAPGDDPRLDAFRIAATHLTLGARSIAGIAAAQPRRVKPLREDSGATRSDGRGPDGTQP